MGTSEKGARKFLIRLRAQADDGKVRLRFYMSTPLFRAPSKRKENLVIRIHRRAEPSFEFGADSEEYFDGLGTHGAERIHEGVLPAINGRKFEFVDEKVKMGTVYAYWVSTDRGDPAVGPVGVKVRDPEVWWPAGKVQARLAALKKNHPDLVTLKGYGRTVRGRALQGVVVGSGDRALALVGTVHAGESGPELIVPALEQLLKEQAGLLAKLRVGALPSVNMDERERLALGTPWYLRTNVNGVDLNRNFDADWKTEDRGYGLLTSDPDSGTYRGPRPASEPETRALMKFMREVKPAAAFSYHHLASIAGAVFLAPKAAARDEEFERRGLGYVTEYARGFHADRRRRGRMRFACSAGSLPTWALKHGRIPCFDLEADLTEPIEKASCMDRTTAAMLRTYQERHYRGILAVLQNLAT